MIENLNRVLPGILNEPPGSVHTAANHPGQVNPGGQVKPAGAGIDEKVRRIILITEQFSAIAARRQARYLTQMGVSLRLLDPGFDTSHLDIHWLSPVELRDYNVVN